MTDNEVPKYAMGAVAALITLTLFGVLGASLEEEHTAAPLPFDPLSPQEESTAIAITLGDTEISAVLSDRFQTIGAALYTDKSYRNLDTWPRMAEVWLYDYGHNLAVRALVDLDHEMISKWNHPDVQPPVTAAEVQLAGEKALQDPRVLERLSDANLPANVHWTARLWTGTGPTACPEHRCLLIAFVHEDAYVESFSVLVDFIDDRVSEILGPHGAPVESQGGLVP